MIDKRLRVVLAEDSVILRDGMVELRGARGCEVVATAGTAPELLAAVAEHRPDVAVVDIRMPPTHSDEGIRAAVEIRSTDPGTGILVFSQHVETAWVARLLAGGAAGTGCLLKERVARTSEFMDALHRVADGGTALDPEVVTGLMRGVRRRLVDSLTPREREVLELMAQGHCLPGAGGPHHRGERARREGHGHSAQGPHRGGAASVLAVQLVRPRGGRGTSSTSDLCRSVHTAILGGGRAPIDGAAPRTGGSVFRTPARSGATAQEISARRPDGGGGDRCRGGRPRRGAARRCGR